MGVPPPGIDLRSCWKAHSMFYPPWPPSPFRKAWEWQDCYRFRHAPLTGCVARVSDRVIAQKLEREQKKINGKRGRIHFPFLLTSRLSASLRSRRLEVAGERENGRARGRHARAVARKHLPRTLYKIKEWFGSLIVSGQWCRLFQAYIHNPTWYFSLRIPHYLNA